MRPQYRTVSSIDQSTPIMVDRLQEDFKVGLQLVVNGTLTASVQTTADPQSDFADADDYNMRADWTDITDLTDVTADAVGNIFFPVQAVRLNVTVYTSGDAELTLLQAHGP